jgi:hypothetical protein
MLVMEEEEEEDESSKEDDDDDEDFLVVPAGVAGSPDLPVRGEGWEKEEEYERQRETENDPLWPRSSCQRTRH